MSEENVEGRAELVLLRATGTASYTGMKIDHEWAAV